MATPDPIQAQLDRILDVMLEVKAGVTAGRLFDIMEVIRDHVAELKMQHEAIRRDIREVFSLLAAQPGSD
jgi:hypothetical protein